MDQSAEHVREISNALYKYHLDNFLCDVFIITPDGSEVPAHSVVLSAVSIKLRAAFEKSDNSLKKNYAFRLHVTDCDVATVEMVLQFIYTGAIVLPQDTPLDVTRILSAGQKLGLDASKLATFLGALLYLTDASVVENMPPVILTDEDICLEIVEKVENPANKPRPVEIIKIKSKHNDVWGVPSDGRDHSYTNDGQPLVRKRGRPPKQVAVNIQSNPVIADHGIADTTGNNTTIDALEGLPVMHNEGNGELTSGELPPELPDVVESGDVPVDRSSSDGISDRCCDQQLTLPVLSPLDEASQTNQSYEVYGAMFGTEAVELDGVTAVIKTEDGLIEEDEANLLHEVLMRSVISGEEHVSVVMTQANIGADGSVPEKKKRGRKPSLVREKVIHICEFKDCGKAFKRLREYINHYRTHTGEKPYVCDLCGKAFIRSYAVTEHRRTHTGEKPFQCDICGRQFSVGGDLTKHKRLHNGEVLYRCKLCGKEMNTGRENADHRRMHEGGIFCQHCGKPFTRLHNMKEHVRIAHTGDKNYVCRDCGKQFAYARNLRYHRRLHKTERPFKCEICGKCFVGAGELGRHERTTHKIQNEFQVLYLTQAIE